MSDDQITSSPSTLEVEHLAAFSDDERGGNPAGVVIDETIPDADLMQRLATEVGYSETAFLTRTASGWRVRYFAPVGEVPFCGHATIASGAVLGQRFGGGVYPLELNNGNATVEAFRDERGQWGATLTSPPPNHRRTPEDLREETLAAFSLGTDDLDHELPDTLASAGAHHLFLFLRQRETLAAMRYPFDPVRSLMLGHGLTTIALVWRESQKLFHARNAFASGGVYEDPATGAAAAALGGYLRTSGLVDGPFTIIQGEDMGQRSVLHVDAGTNSERGVRVSGLVRKLP